MGGGEVNVTFLLKWSTEHSDKSQTTITWTPSDKASWYTLDAPIFCYNIDDEYFCTYVTFVQDRRY